MKPFGEFFEIMLNSCCAFLGVNNNDFFEFCFKTFHANHESRIRGISIHAPRTGSDSAK